MPPRENKEYTRRRIAQDGAWVAIEQMYLEKLADEDWARRSYHVLFGYALELIQEALKEIRRLNAVLGRLEPVCQRGKKIWPGTAMSSEYSALNQELLPLLGWTASLVETVYTLQGLIHPKAVPERIEQLKKALTSMHYQRQADGFILTKYSDLFKPLSELPH